VFWFNALIILSNGAQTKIGSMTAGQKVLRKVTGNWTFVVISDRNDLDKQIYKKFATTGIVTEDCQAESGSQLRQLLTEDHLFIFTLIQKFVHERPKDAPKGWIPSGPYPLLSARSDIIVMTDEAHRSQYDTLALNMRNALPNAAFIGFTGTPLMAGEEKTKEVFGDYVSIYNFQQSIDDGATVSSIEATIRKPNGCIDSTMH